MDALAEAGVAANVEKVTDLMKIASYGVFGTPAVVVDGQVKSVARFPAKRMLNPGYGNKEAVWLTIAAPAVEMS